MGFDKDAGGVIYQNRKQEYQDILRLEDHVEVTADREQESPAKAVRQQEEEDCCYQEVDNKMEGVEKHAASDGCYDKQAQNAGCMRPVWPQESPGIFMCA